MFYSEAILNSVNVSSLILCGIRIWLEKALSHLNSQELAGFQDSSGKLSGLWLHVNMMCSLFFF